MCHKSTYIKRKEKKEENILSSVGGLVRMRVHKGPNDGEDMNMLRHKWLAGNGVAMGTTAKSLL